MIKIALYQPQIPPNTGNISRLLVGLDIEMIIIGPMGFQINDKTVKRAGLDYWEHLKLEIFENYQQFLERYGSNRLIFATTKGTTPYFNFTYQEDDIIIFGSETTGVPMELLTENLNQTITIPMPGQVRSLNLSNSVAVVTYHSLIQLGYFDQFIANRNVKELPS